MNEHIRPAVATLGLMIALTGIAYPLAMTRLGQALLPEQAIVVDEGITSGRGVPGATRGAPPHDWLQITGGSIGIGLPLAVGAAVACPDRRVVAPQADGMSILTVEGIAPSATELHPLQEAFRDHHGLQCGFCTPGMLTTLLELLDDNPDPTEREVREAISGNLCRCTGYQGIVDAALDAARRLRGSVI